MIDGRWVMAAVLLASPAALGGERETKILGWSADGKFLAWEDATDNGGVGGSWESSVKGVVLDLATDQREQFVLAEEGEGVEEGSEGTYAENEKRFRARVAALKLAKPATGQNGPKGTKAVVTAKGNSGQWSKGSFGYSGETLPPADEEDGSFPEFKRGELVLAVTSGGKTRTTATAEWGGRGGTAVPHWSPDGRWIAWLVERTDAFPGGGETWHEILVAETGRPPVEVLVPDAIRATALPKAMEALRKAGFRPVRSGKAKASREKSAVYAAKGAEAEAKKVAAAVPGGATVEALTWKTDAEIVIALGTSAVASPDATPRVP